jgi:hypothetical protein
VLGVDVGGTGIAKPGGSLRYLTVPLGGSTLVLAVRRAGGEIVRSNVVHGSFTIPAVAYDSTPGGLSGDGRTLVLIEPRTRFPRRATTLLVLDARTLLRRALITLRGDFSFDAVSPRGDRIALINYTSPVDPTRYTVRSLATDTGRLDPRPIVDPHDPAEKMRGNPLSRASTPDGRFAYTLYDGGGTMPFVHALDTARMTARCIDLDALAGQPLQQLRLRLDRGGGAVAVTDGTRRLLEIDRATYAVTVPTASHGWNWTLTGVLTLAALAVAVLVLVVVRRSRMSQKEAVPVD